MDFKIKTEQVDDKSEIGLVIKQEEELLIENDNHWGEADGYYQEYGLSVQQGDNNQAQIKDEPLETFYGQKYDETYEYDAYNEDDDDLEDNYYEESSNEEIPDGGYSGENYDDEDNSEAENNDSTSNEAKSSLLPETNILSLRQWINTNFTGRACHLCSNIARNPYDWRKHLETEHLKCISEAEQYFKIEGTKGICKKCNQSVDRGYLQVLHSLEHLNVEIVVCKVCNYSTSRPSFVKKHIVEKHSEVLEQFKNTKYGGKLFKCPICPFSYGRYCQLSCHIKDEHSQNFLDKFTYTCHLCLEAPFKDKDLYLEHLIEDHELDSWKTLQYKRLPENKALFVCLKCSAILVGNNKKRLLNHYLVHIAECRWKCGHCHKKLSLTRTNFSHMCTKMIQYYIANGSKAPLKRKLNNWQEFEEYIYHVCSFCNEMFNTTREWQGHLKTVHQINALKSLKMKIIPGELNKLSCIVCHTMVVNTPVELHAHCFQHLPYKPYKCTHCSENIATYKTALNHVLNRCKNINKALKMADKTNMKQGIRASIVIRCTLCKNEQFHDPKELFNHFEQEHNNFEEFFVKQADNSITCNVCSKNFLQYDKDFCLKHFHHHLDEKAFKCIICSNSYTTLKFCYKHLLYLHYATPMNEKQTSVTNEIKEMSSALLSTSAEEDVTMSTKFKLARFKCKSAALNEFSEYITYACPECNESMPSHKAWYEHISTHHDFFLESNLMTKGGDGSITCPTCKMKLASNMSSQQKHKLTHMPYRSFICSLCYSRFNSLGILYGHLRRHHFSTGSFPCPICSDILKTAYERTEHLKAVHPMNEWPDSLCLICYKPLRHKSSLSRHMTLHDADRVRFTCDVCGAKLLGKKDFQWHLDRHKKRGEKRKLDIADSEIETDELFSKKNMN